MTGERRAASSERSWGFLLAARCSLLAIVACAHRPPAPPPLPPTAVPRAAVDMMCSRMHAEGMAGELRALKMTQPLITPQSVQALAEAMFYRGGSVPPQIAVAGSVPVETAGSCVTHPLDSITSRDSDVMIVAFSSPFENPFVRGQLGVFARVSLGGEAATWYWIPIGQRGGAWGAANPVMLAVRD
jgi:hypothetical protein